MALKSENSLEMIYLVVDKSEGYEILSIHARRFDAIKEVEKQKAKKEGDKSSIEYEIRFIKMESYEREHEVINPKDLKRKTIYGHSMDDLRLKYDANEWYNLHGIEMNYNPFKLAPYKIRLREKTIFEKEHDEDFEDVMNSIILKTKKQ